ncbi:unnamed protein product [Darwinula stevensoni]|uniref:DDE-1 domain-containing protein n=1 Tax=Darwinula stevensoni TaxID=69355 RepID=A0A7R8X993_9CRUS|nr:unnamed protein product [Darwinula stevensoni]CAG0888773.1 unnamed protein product [Darwinula stevensoni]
MQLKGDKCIGGKRSKERLTVLLCTNMSGKEKLQPTIIGKFEKPRSFRGVRHLPANYRQSKKAWMTTPLFLEFLRCLDAKMGWKGRKILLFDH